MYDQDSYGYYLFNNQKSYNKYDVISKAEQIEDVKWIYNDEYFSSFDWTKEPAPNLPDLYAARALKLRQQYDYIILMYSGGSDSFNILDTFVNYDIKLDEVAHLINYEGSKNKNNFQNKEIFDVAIPKIDKLINQKRLSTISRVVDITKREINGFNSKTKFDFIHTINNFASPYSQAKTKLYLEVKKWRDLVAAGKKLCFIWGAGKPKVRYQDSKYFFYFMDVIDLRRSVGFSDQMIGDDGPIDELFYWAPTFESTQIMIKQAHLIKNYFSIEHNLNFLQQIRYRAGEEMSGRFSTSTDKNIYLGGELLKKLIYPNWNSLDGIMLKSPSGVILSSRDDWFWKDVNHPATTIFLNGILHLRNTIKQCWIEDYISYNNELYPKKIRVIATKSYYL
jgi:hypothetical protein